MDFDEEAGVGVLRWKPNPGGRRPARYRVYGSDEKGFFASDRPRRANFRDQARTLPDEIPANFVAETDATELAVVGQGIDLPNANKAHYRVVAVDDGGGRSYSSDFVEAPRPLIYTTPVARAAVGQPYRYQLAAIRSIGDIKVRNGYKGYCDVETPAFQLIEGPDWLEIDEAGLLTGTPDAAGRVEVKVSATIDREVRTYDLNALQWGTDKAEVTTQRLGPATQEFMIDVRP
jgi:hypothetical protein